MFIGSIIAPALLRNVMEWEKRVDLQLPEWEKPSGLYLGIIADGNGGYTCSPVDSITFATTGMDGIHYSLLTDFSTTTRLEEAPVICVSPMDFGNCVRLVADNIRDFFSLQFTGNDLLLLNDFTSKEEYLEAVRQQRQDRTWQIRKKKVWRLAREQFGFEPLSDPYEYIQNIRRRRKEKIVIPTLDGLGIIPARHDRIGREYTPHYWTNKEIPYQQLDKLKLFFNSSEPETKLSFIRDYQAQGISDMNSLRFLYDELETMGMPLEAKKLLHCLND